MDQPHIRGAAVLTVIAIVTQHEIFVISQRNRLCRETGVLYHFIAIMLMQRLPVDPDNTVHNLHCLTRKSDDPLDIICIFFIPVWKYNNIVTARIAEPV